MKYPLCDWLDLLRRFETVVFPVLVLSTAQKPQLAMRGRVPKRVAIAWAIVGPFSNFFCSSFAQNQPRSAASAASAESDGGKLSGRPSSTFLLKHVRKMLTTRCEVPRNSAVPVIISVSGGQDSVALLCLVHEVSKRWCPTWKLYVLHFNHGLRPEASEEEVFVKDLAKTLDVPFFVRHHPDPPSLKGSKSGLQAAARAWRQAESKKLLGSLASFDAAPKGVILFAHHADDQGVLELVEQHRVIGGPAQHVFLCDKATISAPISSCKAWLAWTSPRALDAGGQHSKLLVRPERDRRFQELYTLDKQVGEGSFGNVQRSSGYGSQDDGLEETIGQMFFKQMLQAVGYLHGRRIVHRDVKSSPWGEGCWDCWDDKKHFHLFQAQDIVLKLCDFGTATVLTEQRPRRWTWRLRNSSIWQSQSTVRKVYQRKGADLPADIWSLGVVLYVILRRSLGFVTAWS
eukprot:Skav207983  [mRNA]  locus=scaffold4447:22899:33072:- [translate_table: standard]